VRREKAKIKREKAKAKKGHCFESCHLFFFSCSLLNGFEEDINVQ
jgi:hypothetical protein